MTRAKAALGVFSLLGVIAFASSSPGQGQGNAEYTVIIKNVEVMTTNKDGNAWDVNDGKPDLCVIIRNTSVANSEAFTSKERTDTFQAEFNEPTTVKVSAGQTLDIQVVDKDVAVNDEIGRTSMKVTEDRFKNNPQKLESFGRVKTLTIEFKKL